MSVDPDTDATIDIQIKYLARLSVAPDTDGSLDFEIPGPGRAPIEERREAVTKHLLL
jgi:hypothetical protein